MAYLRLSLTGMRLGRTAAHAGVRLPVVHHYRASQLPLTRHETEAIAVRLGAGVHPAFYGAGRDLAAARLGYADEGNERGSSWWISVAVLGGAALIGGAFFFAQIAEGNRNSD